MQFFAAAAEHERIATFQTHHALAGIGQFNHQCVDARLGGIVIAANVFAHFNSLGIAACQRQYLGTDQAVVQDDIGIIQHPQRAQRQQAGVAGTCTHQRHAALHMPCTSVQLGLDHVLRRRCLAAPQQRLRRASQYPPEECAACGQIRQAVANAAAQLAEQLRQCTHRIIKLKLQLLA